MFEVKIKKLQTATADCVLFERLTVGSGGWQTKVLYLLSRFKAMSFLTIGAQRLLDGISLL